MVENPSPHEPDNALGEIQQLQADKESAIELLREATAELDRVKASFQDLVDHELLPYREHMRALTEVLTLTKRQAISALEQNHFEAVNDDVIARLKKLQASIEQLKSHPPALSEQGQNEFDSAHKQALEDFRTANELYDEALAKWTHAEAMRSGEAIQTITENLKPEFAEHGVVKPEDIRHYVNLAGHMLKFGTSPDAIIEAVIRRIKKGDHVLDSEHMRHVESFV